VRWWFGLASGVFVTPGLGSAGAVLETAPESVRNPPRYGLTAGGLAMAGGDLPAAEVAYGQALQRSQAGNRLVAERTEAAACLIEAQLRQGKTSDAPATSEVMIAATPGSSVASTIRAQVLATNGQHDPAGIMLERVVSAEPDNLRARALLGMVQLQQGNLG